MQLKLTLMDHAIQNKFPSSFKCLCLSTIMSSNCSPAFNRWMTGYFTFQQTAAMRIRRMEKKQKFFSNRSKVVAPPKVSFCAEADFETETETRLAFFNRDEKKRKKRECHFPGMESTFPLYFSSPYFCREWNRDKNRNSWVIFFLSSNQPKQVLPRCRCRRGRCRCCCGCGRRHRHCCRRCCWCCCCGRHRCRGGFVVNPSRLELC